MTKWAEKICLVSSLSPYRELGTLEAIFSNYSLLSSSQCSCFSCLSMLNLHNSHFHWNLTQHIDLNRRVCFAFQPLNGQYHLQAFFNRHLNFSEIQVSAQSSMVDLISKRVLQVSVVKHQ